MLISKVILVISIGGILLNFLGVLMSWGKKFPWIESPDLPGYGFLLGTLALVGSAVSAIFWIIYLRRAVVYGLIMTVLGELTVLSASSIWIINPYVFPWRWGQTTTGLGFNTLGGYYVPYGAYVSLQGSIVTLIIAVFSFLHRKDQ
jgi:hypothetical protein